MITGKIELTIKTFYSNPDNSNKSLELKLSERQLINWLRNIPISRAEYNPLQSLIDESIDYFTFEGVRITKKEVLPDERVVQEIADSVEPK